jgi:hypothetical protein
MSDISHDAIGSLRDHAELSPKSVPARQNIWRPTTTSTSGPSALEPDRMPERGAWFPGDVR